MSTSCDFFLTETFTGSFFSTQMLFDIKFCQDIFILGIAMLVSDLIAISPGGSSGRRAACQPAWWLEPHPLQASGQGSGQSS